MNVLTAILLGLVQGLTEFLPISSSGHLVIAQSLLKFEGPSVAFDLMLHMGTLLAVIIYFREDIGQLFLPHRNEAGSRVGSNWLLLLVIGSIPTALIGFAFKEQFETLFGKPHLAALMLWVTAVILALADRVSIRQNPGKPMNAIRALIVGTVQGIAIIPGISRSGSTISAAIFAGVNASVAARFSFLLSIPAIIGASLLEIKDFSGIGAQNIFATAAGIVAAFLSGLLAIDILLKVLVRHNLWKFSIYLFIIGLIGLLLTG